MKHEELFADFAELESTCSQNADEDKILNSKSVYAPIGELKAASRRVRIILVVPLD